MSSSLEERLKTNSSAFDGLLSLIPAKYYYDDDTQDQWKAKKQSKEESKQNKRAKLDPTAEQHDQGASASQVLKKRAKDAKPVVLPGQKTLPAIVQEEDDTEQSNESEEQDDEDEEMVDEETPTSQESQKTNGKPTLKESQKANGKLNGNGNTNGKLNGKLQQDKQNGEDEEEESINFIFDDEGNEVDLDSEEQQQPRKAPKVRELSEEEKRKKQEATKALRDKLASKINTLKERRKAPGTKAVGAPSSREAILEERRKKAAIKEERKRKREELENDDSEDEDEEEEDESEVENDESVIYQTIQFDENSRTTSDLQNLRTKQKKKGPAKKDIKAHLKLIEAKKQKLSQLEGSKQQELADKEKWNRTIAQAEGHKLRDDEKLLKKALKKKEAQKRKSEIQWQDRKDHVENMVSAKQKRREENLQIRKDNRGIKRKNQTKQKRKFKAGVSQKRAGFEGRMKTGKKK